MTHVLTIDGRQFSDGKAVHRMLKTLLLLSLGGEDTAKTLRKVACVVQDLGGTVIWADEKQERN